MLPKSRYRTAQQNRQSVRLSPLSFGLALTSAYYSAEDVRIGAVVISELKLGNVERHVFSTHLWKRRMVRRLEFNEEYRPKRTHRVTTGLDPVVHGDTRRMRRHGETELEGSPHG